MSKLKLMYDVINTMKDKEAINGALKVVGTKDQTKIVGFVNEFEKNLSSGETKVKISTELDYNGKKMKHESQTEFTAQGCHGHMHHGFMKHMHHHHSHNGCESPEAMKCGGIREKLTRFAFVLNLFNQIKMDEKEDQSVILSLNLKDIPEEMKKAIQERMSQRTMPEHHHHHHGCMKEFFTLEESEIQLNLWISKTRDLEKIMITVTGKQTKEQNELHDLKLTAELSLFS